VLTVVGGKVVQSVMVDTGRVPRRNVGNEFRLFGPGPSGVPTIFRIRPTLPVSWHPEEVKVTAEAASALSGTSIPL
ncbi:hypothetical protein KIPB_015867, partial [Kipferlia bialata]